MIVVDTSVLVPILRSAPTPEWGVFWQLVDADLIALPTIARQEVRAGLSKHNRRKVLDLLSALPVAPLSDASWERVEHWTDQAADAGERFSLPDLLIAAIADELGALVWTLDRDFERMAKLKFVRLYR